MTCQTRAERRAANRIRDYNQRYHLPKQLEAARAKVVMLERKAIRMGLPELVGSNR